MGIRDAAMHLPSQLGIGALLVLSTLITVAFATDVSDDEGNGCHYLAEYDEATGCSCPSEMLGTGVGNTVEGTTAGCRTTGYAVRILFPSDDLQVFFNGFSPEGIATF